MNPHLDRERADFLRSRIDPTKKERLSAWHHEDKLLPVVELDISWVRFSVLNHRTKAEQQRICRDKDAPDLFASDPLGNAAQDAQFEILKTQQGFEELATDLTTRGQQEPAVVTAEGVLVNGNRRVAALRSIYAKGHLNAKYVRCIVLPEATGIDEIRRLETELQVAKRFEEDYSWINRLLLIDELLKTNNMDFAIVAKLMRADESDIHSAMQVLGQVDQLVAISNRNYLHIDFEPNESAFTELAKHIANKSPEEAEPAQTAYFMGILSGCTYRELRDLRRSTATRYIAVELEDNETLQSVTTLTAAPVANDPVDALLEGALGATAAPSQVAQLLPFIAGHPKDERVPLPTGGEIGMDTVLKNVAVVIKQAASEARADDEDHETVKTPLKRAAEAADKLLRAETIIDQARSLDGWNEGTFIAELDRIVASVVRLKKT
jgi:ParB-like chromosome segregation protein Spo0J